MTTPIGRAKLTTKNGKTVIELSKPRLAVGQRKRIESQAVRAEKKWKAKSK